MNCQSYYPCRPQQEENELSDFFPEGYKIRPAYKKYPYYLSIPFQAEEDDDDEHCHNHHHCRCCHCNCCRCRCWNCPYHPYYRCNRCCGNVNYHHVHCSCNRCRCQDCGR